MNIFFSFDCAYKTWKNGGVSTFSKFKSLYSGSGVNILLITPEKAIKLVANDFFRYKLSCPEKKFVLVIYKIINAYIIVCIYLKNL